MTKYFTDASGQKYELVASSGFLRDRTEIVIKPIVERRFEIHRPSFYADTPNGPNCMIQIDMYCFTPPKAQAVAEAIKALMEFLPTKIDGGKPTTDANNRMTAAISKARKLLQEDTE